MNTFAKMASQLASLEGFLVGEDNATFLREINKKLDSTDTIQITQEEIDKVDEIHKAVFSVN